MKGKFKRAILSCLLAFGISVSLIGTDISMIASFAEEKASKTTVISAEEFKDLTLEDCEKIAESIDVTPNQNGEVILDLTEEELYAIITASEHDKAAILEDTSCEKDDSAYSDGSSDYLYNQLNTKEKEFYDDLKAYCQSFMNSTSDFTNTWLSVSYDTSINYQRACAVTAAFYYENPQFYFMPARYLPVEGNISNGKYVYLFGTSDIFRSASTRASTNTQIASITSTWKAGINQYSVPYDKEQYIADTLCEKIVYTKDTIYNQSIYGALVNKQCVCNGYAMAFTYLCNIAGLEAFGVPSPGHAWNMVKVDSKWHCVDVTWMDSGDEPNHTWFNRSHSVFVENDTSTCHDIYSDYANNFTLPVTVDSDEHIIFLVSDGTNSVNVSERDIASFANDPTKDYTVKYTKSGGYCFETDLSKIKAKSVTFSLTGSNEMFYSFKNLHFNFNAVFDSVFDSYGDLYADGFTSTGYYAGFNGSTEIKSLTLYGNSTVKMGKNHGSAVSVDELIFNCGSQNSYANIYADTTIGNITVQSGNVYLSVLDGVNARVTGDITASSKINLRYMKSGTTSTGSERVYNAAIPYDDFKILTVDNTSIGTSVFKSDYAAFTSADCTDYYWVKYNVYKKGNDIVLSTADPSSAALSIKNSNIYVFNGNDLCRDGDKISAGSVLTFKIRNADYKDKRLTINGQKADTFMGPFNEAYYYQYEVPNDGSVITADLVSEKWSDEQLNQFLVMNIEDGIQVYPYCKESNRNLPEMMKSGALYPKDEAVAILVPEESLADGKSTIINGKTVEGTLYRFDEGYFYEIWAYNVGTSDICKICTGSAAKITSQPTDVTAVPGGVATFKVTASGEGLAYQWQYSHDNGKTWKNLDVNAASCTIITSPGVNSYLFRCVVTDENGVTAESNAAKVTVKAISEVTVEEVQKLDIKSIIRFVDLFDESADILTDAQIKAIELVLEYDYS